MPCNQTHENNPHMCGTNQGYQNCRQLHRRLLVRRRCDTNQLQQPLQLHSDKQGCYAATFTNNKPLCHKNMMARDDCHRKTVVMIVADAGLCQLNSRAHSDLFFIMMSQAGLVPPQKNMWVHL